MIQPCQNNDVILFFLNHFCVDIVGITNVIVTVDTVHSSSFFVGLYFEHMLFGVRIVIYDSNNTTFHIVHFRF